VSGSFILQNSTKNINLMKTHCKCGYSLKKIEASVVALSSVVLLIAGVVYFRYSPSRQPTVSGSAQNMLKGWTVWHVGGSSEMIDSVLSEMERAGAVVKHSTWFILFSFLNSSSIVVFDGNWISAQEDRYEAHFFLREASSRRAALTAIGGSTSGLFDALDKAGVNELARDEAGNVRNPASINPRAAGFTWRYAVTPYSTQYSYPSMLITNAQGAHDIVEVIAGWV
jgi:hypothetical protein